MDKLLFFLFLILTFSLQGQVLTRSSDDLHLKLSARFEKMADCKSTKAYSVKLLAKDKDENELTCSDQNTWKLVSTLENQTADNYIFDNKPSGIYKVVVKIPLSCPESGIKSKYEIIRIQESNILNELTDAMEVTPVRKMQEDKIIVFPNPSAEKIWINIESDDVNEKAKFTIQVINGAGQLIKEKVVSERRSEYIQFDLSSFSAGQYTLLVLKEDEIYASRKIAKITK